MGRLAQKIQRIHYVWESYTSGSKKGWDYLKNEKKHLFFRRLAEVCKKVWKLVT